MMTSFIKTALILGAFVLFTSSAHAASISSVQSGNWSSGSTWSTGTVPGANDTVTIGHSVTYDVTSSRAAGVTVNSGATLAFSPSKTVTLETNKNVVVNGTLQMKPNSASIVHTLRFVDVDESKFVGGGMDVLDSDVGLWVMGAGKLDILGTPKTSWTRLTGGANAGASTITVQDATGWRVGDEIVIVPTEHPSVGTRSWNGFEGRTITAISGNTITLNSALSHAHPSATNPFTNKVFTAEVLNLSRNVQIEGTSSGKSHTLIRSSVPQSIRFLEVDYLGSTKVLGRYPIHFHMAGDGSRGSLVEGVTVRRSDQHAFVPHGSHGITMRDTISYDTFEDAYWWDPYTTKPKEEDANRTDDLVMDRAVAAHVKHGPRSLRRLTGFNLRHSAFDALPILRNSVAVGVEANGDSSGFLWPETSGGLWIFDVGNIAHNNGKNGIFTWQNSGNRHQIKNFVGYRNGAWGVSHGAYINLYAYIDVDVFENGRGGLVSHAAGICASDNCYRPDGYAIAFERYRSTDKLHIASHRLEKLAGMPDEPPVLYKDCVFSRVDVDELAGGKSNSSLQDFVNCTKPNGGSLEPSDFNIISIGSKTVIRVQRPNGTAFKISGPSGSVSTISAFYTNTGSTDPAPSPDPDVTASLSASPTSIIEGESSTLTWSSSGATSCTVSYLDGAGNEIAVVSNGGTSGSVGVTPQTTTTYELTCSNATKSGFDEATVTVSKPDPTASLSASPTSITQGGSSTLSWSSTNADSCAGDSFDTGGNTSGSVVVSPAADTTYTLTCTQAGKDSSDTTKTATDSVTVTVSGLPPAPTASLSASPSSLVEGESSTLTWSSTDAESCEGTNFSTGGKLSGTSTVFPVENTTYTVTCTNVSGSASDSATVTVSPASDEPEPAPDPGTGLIHHYTLDEGSGSTATDSAGNIDGAITGGMWTTGKLGNALSFDGIDDRIDLGTMNISGSAITLSAWIKADTWDGGDLRIISKAVPGYLWQLSERNNRLRFRITANGKLVTLHAGSLSTGVWQHVAGVYDGSSMRLYVDGVETGSAAQSGTINTSDAAQAWIGAEPNGSDFFDGTIDDVRIYNTALSASEIASLAGASASGDGTATIATAPTASLAASPITINPGQQATLSWSSTDADTCTGTNFSTGNAPSGSTSVAPTETTTYSVSCTGAGGTASASVTINVVPAPTAMITATPSSIGSGDSSTISWSSTNATSCTGTNFSTGGAISGSVNVIPTQSTTYSVTCTGDGGSVQQSVVVNVANFPAAPTISFPQGSFNWGTTGATGCSASGAWSGAQALTGTHAFSSPVTDGTYTLTCTGDGGTVARTFSVSTAHSGTASIKFSLGQHVQTTDALNVRSSASLSGTKLGTQPKGAQGSVIGGPIEADGYWWWQIDYDNAPDGWSVENWLE